jgi:hypothetical protein
MAHKSSKDKFIIIGDESDDAVVSSLTRLAMKHAYDNENPSNPMMFADEILCELFEEMAKGLKHYKDLPYSQKLAVIRRMMDNRISELRYKYYLTYRGESKHDVSIENDNQEVAVCASKELSPEDRLILKDNYQELYDSVSDGAREVLDCVMRDSNPRFLEIMKLHAIRNEGRSQRIRPHMIADALLISEEEARRRIAEIKLAYRRIYVGSK